MIRLIAFDLDDTLADVGKQADQGVIEKLQKLDELGFVLAICSGKPVYYLCGFARQAGLYNAILVGENGGTIQFGIDLPPKFSFAQKLSSKAKNSIALLREEIKNAIPSIWFQPNEIALTPFPKNEEEHHIIEEIIQKHKDELEDIEIIHHVDSFDIQPANFDKRKSLKILGQLLHISSDDMVAVGNGKNDYPMFEYAGLSLGVNVPDQEKVYKNFESVSDALDYLGYILYSQLNYLNCSNLI